MKDLTRENEKESQSGVTERNEYQDELKMYDRKERKTRDKNIRHKHHQQERTVDDGGTVMLTYCLAHVSLIHSLYINYL